MLITTSLIYVLLNAMRGSLFVLWWWLEHYSNIGDDTTSYVDKCFDVSNAVRKLIFAYNFYVYLITGKLFRCDLYKLLCRCSSGSSSPPV